ncbi:hypothetical protein PQ459_11100 [Chryseobacterium sp. KACC 21268]|nr:hypothetical protein PQ459_11100 [Chryseobacterium sp. KACC 21268]
MKTKSLTLVILLIFGVVGVGSKVFSQDLQNEMYFNQNRIINESVLNDSINSKFVKSSKLENVNIFIEQKDKDKFSIFVKNSSSENLVLVPQDYSLYLIQEAIDKKGKWKPIEFWGFSTCGNSYDRKIKFNPNQIIELDSPKYKGDFSTKIRFKLRLNNQVYYSNSIPSTINISKFQKSKWYNEYLEIFQMSPKSEIEDWLYINKEVQ